MSGLCLQCPVYGNLPALSARRPDPAVPAVLLVAADAPHAAVPAVLLVAADASHAALSLRLRSPLLPVRTRMVNEPFGVRWGVQSTLTRPKKGTELSHGEVQSPFIVLHLPNWGWRPNILDSPPSMRDNIQLRDSSLVRVRA
jgi:hypothetical protein